jgi:crotonobetainyl-CoA:carnitine CoA-transferase CaiB-like acyl-CoA transferase
MSVDKGPLDGLVVVDLSTNLASAYTSLLFADYGAEVVSVERPGGSALRQVAGWPFFFRGKKSLVADLKDPGDLEVVRSLAAGSDVVVEAFGAGAADRLGVGDDVLRPHNPRLVYTSITGFGHHGPFAHLKAHESVVMAKTGSMYGNIAPDRPGEPVMMTPHGATFGGALLAIQGTLLALHERESSGFGQRVEATMVQGMLAQDPWSYFTKMLTERYPDAFKAVGAPEPGRPVPTSWLAFGLLNGFTKDARWLQFAHATPRQFEAFVRALGLADKRGDPRWADAPDSPDPAVRDAWWTMMLERVRARTVDEWQEVFDADKDVFGETYRNGLELLDHPQMVHDEHVVEVKHPELGMIRELNVLVKMSKTPGSALRPVPDLDEHGAEVRRGQATAGAVSIDRRPSPPGPPPEAALPLAGITVVDLGTFYAGPFGSAMLADQGATVIKIEPLDGDPIRFQMPMPESAGVRVTQGKKSLAVDVFAPEGHQIVTDLIRQADIVLHCYRGGVAERMGLDDVAIRELNPNLVYHHGVGYGVHGPHVRRAAFAPTIAAASGFARRSGGGGPEGAELTTDQIKDATLRMGGAPPGHPDGMAALGVAVGMLLGLYARDRGAGGQITQTSMLSTMGHVLSDSVIHYDNAPTPPVPDPDAYGFSAVHRLYKASDGWIVLVAPGDRGWAALSRALPPSRLADDPRFATPEARHRHDHELVAALSGVFAAATAQNWEHQLSDAGVGCAEVVPLQGGLAMGLFQPGGVCDQLGMLTTVTHPLFDQHVRSDVLVRLSRGAATLGAGCTIGQHTDEVLRDRLSYDQTRIDDLRARGVIGG